MGAVVAPEVDLPAPVFDQAVGVADGQGGISFLAFEKEVPRLGHGLGQIRLQGFVRGLVDDQDVCLACFLLPDPDGVSWFYTLHVLDFKLQKIADPEPVVYAHGEQEVVSGFKARVALEAYKGKKIQLIQPVSSRCIPIRFPNGRNTSLKHPSVLQWHP